MDTLPGKQWAGWRVGVTAVGLGMMFFGACLVAGHMRSGLGFINVLGFVSLFLLSGGCGLVFKRAWSRFAALTAMPIFLFFAIPLLRRPYPARLHSMILGFCIFCGVSLIYLLLPPVARVFPRRARVAHEAVSGIPVLAPPPRAVPRSLRLAVTWGPPHGFVFTLVMGLVCMTMAFQWKTVLSGVDVRQDPAFLLLLLVPLALAAIGAIGARYVLKAGRGVVEFLATGGLCSATITRISIVPAGEDEMYRLSYEYKVAGTDYCSYEDLYYKPRLAPGAVEPVLFRTENPFTARLLRSFPARIRVDAGGNWVHRFAFTGYLYAALPILVVLVTAFLALK